ncbi:MAG: hypothetical protein PWP65_1337 [Clostridia bacterium]|nr:hypothetical protein [Clostridia bacterium]
MITLGFLLLSLAIALFLSFSALRRAGNREPIAPCLLLLVKDQADQIEGLLRDFWVWAHFRGRPVETVMVDAGSRDETPVILQKLALYDPALTVVRELPGEEVNVRRLIGEYSSRGRLVFLDIRAEKDFRALRRRLRQALAAGGSRQRLFRKGYGSL